MRFSTILIAATLGLATSVYADKLSYCNKPAVLSTCKRDCSCDAGHTKPDCSEPTCSNNCFCREDTPPPRYGSPAPPPYSAKKNSHHKREAEVEIIEKRAVEFIV